MQTIELKYRSWYQGQPPKPIKLQIPGWSGEQNEHKNGDKPQPWHCPPFVDGSTYGLELYYPFDTECHVSIENEKLKFEGDFEKEQTKIPEITLPPFMSFAPGHFGMTSALDIKVPEGYVLRTEPHPRFYTDTTGTVPCCLPGHLQTDWWPRIFFVVFKNPYPGQKLIFRKNEPYGQILILPRKVCYDIKEMTNGEKAARSTSDAKINTYAKKICKNDWHDHIGHNFDDKYKVLSSTNAKNGCDSVNKFIDTIDTKKIFRGKFIKRKKDEGIQNQEKKP